MPELHRLGCGKYYNGFNKSTYYTNEDAVEKVIRYIKHSYINIFISISKYQYSNIYPYILVSLNILILYILLLFSLVVTFFTSVVFLRIRAG